MTVFVYAKNHPDARRVARQLGLEDDGWTHISGPDQIRAIKSFHLILGAPLTMGLDYVISVARASGGKVTLQEVWT